ncbi:MAG: hypothetical protein K9N06_01205 [Candidatus Cloacimonetes bacterium]|nr:hypothetical protein [Candidatus Cloacimonadota bacterium]
MEQVPIKYMHVYDDVMIFNDRTQPGKEKLIIYDLTQQSSMNEIVLPDSSEISFNAVFDKDKGRLFLYDRMQNTELIYQYESYNHVKKYVGLYPRSFLFHDKLNLVDNYLLYTVQQDLTGYIHDHYFSEIYDLNKCKILRYRYVFNIVETAEYFGYLKFDKELGVGKIDLELYEKKNEIK